VRSAARRLLVGFDGTPAAVAALRHAIRIARRNHGLLVVVYVAPERPAVVLVSPLGMCSPLPESPTLASELLRDACGQIPEQISVVRVVQPGRVGPALAEAAERFACDTIVIGTHRGLWSAITGGVECYLRRHAEARLIVAGTRAPRRRSPQAATGNAAGMRARPRAA
jgi:nucleotide-binding universal stress UspA family protein